MNSDTVLSRLSTALMLAVACSTTLAQAPAAKAPATSPPAAAAGAVASGQAVGTFTVKGRVITLAHASAFVDESDKRKLVILLLTEQPVPAAGWKSGTDIMRYRMDRKPLIGVAFKLDDKREVIGADYYEGDFPTSTSGIFVLKLDGPVGKTLAGSATATETAGKLREPVNLNVRFSATLK